MAAHSSTMISYVCFELLNPQMGVSESAVNSASTFAGPFTEQTLPIVRSSLHLDAREHEDNRSSSGSGIHVSTTSERQKC